MSANAAGTKILKIEDARKIAKAAAAPPFDADAVHQRITRARVAPNAEERAIAASLVIDDADRMLRALQLMGEEILHYRKQLEILAVQNGDLSTINSVLLIAAGGEVRCDGAWFRDFEVKGGYEVTEDGPDVVIRAMVVDEVPPNVVRSKSANQQTEAS